ncbi:MAG: hypothetical protein HYU66_29050 [Armatimonadetes bacterium]|nr:hypothetical protein [Armatimonadota bacterium]
MSHRDRLLAAVRRQPVDGLPFCTYNLHPYGNSAHRTDPGYAELLELVTSRAGMLCKASARAGLRWQDPACAECRVERNDGRTTTLHLLHTPLGELRCQVTVPRGQPGYVTEHWVKTDADLERYFCLPWVVGEPDLGPALAMQTELGDRGLLYVDYGDPMYHAAGLFNYEDFTIRCLTDLPGTRAVVERMFERVAEQTRRVAAAAEGQPFLFYTAGPELATPPMLPPHVFAELVTPYQRELVRILHEHGHLVTCHCHGRVRDALPELLACEFDALEPLEPPPQGDITLGELFARCEGRMALMGYIQDQEFHSAAPGHLRRVVEEVRQVVAGRPGYVMCPTCTPFQHPPSEVFVRNYREWVEAAGE